MGSCLFYGIISLPRTLEMTRERAPSELPDLEESCDLLWRSCEERSVMRACWCILLFRLLLYNYLCLSCIYLSVMPILLFDFTCSVLNSFCSNSSCNLHASIYL